MDKGRLYSIVGSYSVPDSIPFWFLALMPASKIIGQEKFLAAVTNHRPCLRRDMGEQCAILMSF
jgi:hypothetical protein